MRWLQRLLQDRATPARDASQQDRPRLHPSDGASHWHAAVPPPCRGVPAISYRVALACLRRLTSIFGGLFDPQVTLDRCSICGGLYGRRLPKFFQPCCPTCDDAQFEELRCWLRHAERYADC